MQTWLRKNFTGLLGIFLLSFWLLVALFGMQFIRTDPISTDLQLRMVPPVGAGGTWEHVLGTDHLGRDILSRLVYGSRYSMLVGFLTVVLSIVIGVPLGMLTGYYGGALDSVVMRAGDIQLAIPFLVMAITVVAVIGPGLENVIITLGIIGWIQFARIARSETLAFKNREFVQAAVSMGAPASRVLIFHILPNIMSSIIVMATFQFGINIIAEASLSFLGLGVPPPTPTWGTMINDGRGYIQNAWWLITIPGIAIVTVVLGANLSGDWLRDRLDPHLKQLG